jgi:hypothetical protein
VSDGVGSQIDIGLDGDAIDGRPEANKVGWVGWVKGRDRNLGTKERGRVDAGHWKGDGERAGLWVRTADDILDVDLVDADGQGFLINDELVAMRENKAARWKFNSWRGGSAPIAANGTPRTAATMMS